jgi:hypothetical protein
MIITLRIIRPASSLNFITLSTFLVKNFLVKKEVHYCDARASPFIAKVRGEVFAHSHSFAPNFGNENV